MASLEKELNLPPVSRDMLHEQIFRLLSEYLMTGRFEPGQRLPLRKLAKSMGTSLMPVRDALQRLETTGCLVSTPQRTMMVPIITAEQHAEISYLRSLLEGEAASRAATERNATELAAMESYCEEMHQAAESADLDLFLMANYHFHMAVAKASRLFFISDLLEPLWMRIGPTIRAKKPNAEEIQLATRTHRKIFQAIRDKAPDTARAMIELDIRQGREGFIDR